MKVVRVPLRISFVGGGTDIPANYSKFLGSVISVTINKYIYITTKPASELFLHDYRLVYSEVENLNCRDQIKHPIISDMVRYYDLSSLDLDVMSDIPSGTGMGSSSAFTVGMHLALDWFPTKYDLAEAACVTEIVRLKEPIGKQDQYAAAFGGLNSFKFSSTGHVRRYDLNTDWKATQYLERHCHLFYLGRTRSASKILETQEMTRRDVLDLSCLSAQAINEILDRDMVSFGDTITSGWEIKKRAFPGCSNEWVDEIIQDALNAGAYGGKLLGAGGTGFVLLIAHHSKMDAIHSAMDKHGVVHVPFKFEFEGAKVLYED